MRESFESFLNEGGALDNVHAANNAHRDGTVLRGDWSIMERQRWSQALPRPGREINDCKNRRRKRCRSWTQHRYVVKMRDQEHPITRGIPEEWLHGKDELYHGQRDPAKNMKILTTAFSDSKGGTGVHEPMLWTIPVGKGLQLPMF